MLNQQLCCIWYVHPYTQNNHGQYFSFSVVCQTGLLYCAVPGYVFIKPGLAPAAAYISDNGLPAILETYLIFILMHLHIRTYLHMYYTLTMQTRKFKGGNTYNCSCHKHQTILHIDIVYYPMATSVCSSACIYISV